jgi:tetratricopeptide (TPR) repeat protein
MAISWSRFNRDSNLAAEKLYRRALELAPDNPKAMAFVSTNVAMKVAHGWSKDIGADSAEAYALGQKAVELLPDDTCVLGSFGHTQSCLGRPGDAIGIHERALEIDPNNAWIHGLQAYALTGAGRADEAVGLLTRALRLSPRDAATHWYLSMLSWAYLQLQQLDDAARESQRSISSFGGWPVAWATLGVARAGLDQLDDARNAAEVAIRLDPRISKDGYSRFFKFIVRDKKYSAQLDDWLVKIWPHAA